VSARACRALAARTGSVEIDGVTFTSARLSRVLAQAGAHAAVLVAVSAGPEIERQAQQAWLEEKPDEYFFLEMFGSAVVEHLVTMTGARLCAWADGQGEAVLPHYSPGYPDWDIADQAALLSLVEGEGLPGALEVLDSGMLRPKKSLLAVFGITTHTERVRRLTDLVPCHRCAYARCQFRRAPYGRAAVGVGAEPQAASANGQPVPVYASSAKALRRWAAERLSITTSGDGTVDALFRYDGTTCSNMGRDMAFHYRVTLGPRDAGYPICRQSCTPAPGDDGHRAMCEYLREGDGLIATIAGEQPLLGRPLDAVLSWQRPKMGPGCYCEPQSRAHKWGLVLETIHYALSHGADPSTP
jgi:hypothetical protein